MSNIKEPIDFEAIASETGVRKGRIFQSTHSGWVVTGHPDIDLICIDTPRQIGDKINGKEITNIKIENNNWVYETQILKEKRHEYQWLSEAFSLNSSLYTGNCANPLATAKKLRSHLDDLKDLMSDIDSLIDDIPL